MRLAVKEIAGQKYAHERRDHCAEESACGMTFAGTTIQRKIHSRTLSQCVMCSYVKSLARAWAVARELR